MAKAAAKAYRVCWPYATVVLLDETGGETVRGFYEGGILPANAQTESVQGLLEKGAVEEVDAEESQEAQVEPPQNTIGVTPPEAPKTEEAPAEVPAEEEDAPVEDVPPLVSASKADWVAYAVSQRKAGVSEQDARAEAEGWSKNDLITMYGG